MKGRRNGVQQIVIALSMVLVILVAVTGLLGYDYSTAEGQISSLKSSGRAYCSLVDSVVSEVAGTFSNVTESLQAQIQADNSIVASLNMTRSSGYEGSVATLNGQITQDLAIIADINSFSSLSPPAANFCPSLGS